MASSMPKMLLSKVKFQAGPTPGAPGLELSLPTVVILVGPNNSGKSQALRELYLRCAGFADVVSKVINGIEINAPGSPEEFEAILAPVIVKPIPGEPEDLGHFKVCHPEFPGCGTATIQISRNELNHAFATTDSQWIREHLLKGLTIQLDGRLRFMIVEPQPTQDFTKHPNNHLTAILVNDASRKRIQELIHETFGKYLLLDISDMGSIRVRMSDVKPPDGYERSLSDEALEFFKKAPLIREYSDGVQAYTGIVCALEGLPDRVVLIDEPEAHLHPPLARRLGSAASRLMESRAGNLFISTHSADFVMGCIESSVDVAIVRVTYEKEVATARALHNEVIEELMRDPLIRTTGALDGVFHRGVVVAESDADRAFYDEINRRLEMERRGIGDALFLNAQNWQTIHRIVKALRLLGVPAAGVLDLDAILQGDESWVRIYEAASIPLQESREIEQLRKSCAEMLIKHGRDQVKIQGSALLTGQERDTLDGLLRMLAKYGIFVVPVGELERWLSHLNVAGGKRDWLSNIFEAMGKARGSNGYVAPASGDVWQFIDSIAVWINDPVRQGIPE